MLGEVSRAASTDATCTHRRVGRKTKLRLWSAHLAPPPQSPLIDGGPLPGLTAPLAPSSPIDGGALSLPHPRPLLLPRLSPALRSLRMPYQQALQLANCREMPSYPRRRRRTYPCENHSTGWQDNEDSKGLPNNQLEKASWRLSGLSAVSIKTEMKTSASIHLH